MPLYLVAVYAITVPSMFLERQVEPSGDLVSILKLACMLAFAWHAWTILGNRRGSTASEVTLAAAIGLVWAALAGLAAYKVIAMLPFDFRGVLAALEDARRTLLAVLGEHGVAIAIGLLVTLAVVAAGGAWLAVRGLRLAAMRFASNRTATAACVGLLVYLVAVDLWYATGELVLYSRWSREAVNTPAPEVPDYSAAVVRSGESVFILQLESVNAHAVFDVSGTGYRPRIPQPGLDAVLREGGGVLFPLFWANGAQTNRAWESILCGISGNLGTPFADDPLRLARHTCLPQKLAGAGYESIFLYAYFDLDFFNLGAFARRAGFRKVAFGRELMGEGARRHEWAYDDCQFYGRAFDYLEKHKLGKRERVFAYFEVGMNHAPFRGTRKYPAVHPYPEPTGVVQAYLNSLAEQDHCLVEFWSRFRGLGRDDVHLFILPDHGLWLPGMPNGPDPTFATWLAYVPPARRQAEFKSRAVVAPVPSQAQLYATVLELLGAERAPASLAFALRGEGVPADYENCVTLAPPGGKLVVHRNGERSQFDVRSGESYRNFRQRLGCGAADKNGQSGGPNASKTP